MNTQHLLNLKITIELDLIELIPICLNFLWSRRIWFLDILNCMIKVREIITARWLVIEVWWLLLNLIAIETVRYFASIFAFFKFQFVVVLSVHPDFFYRYFWVFLYFTVFFYLLFYFVFKILFGYLVIPFFI